MSSETQVKSEEQIAAEQVLQSVMEELDMIDFQMNQLQLRIKMRAYTRFD